MAAAVPVETIVVAMGAVEHELRVLSMVDRRGRKPHRRKQWLLVRGIERVLHGIGDSDRSTGRFALHLGKCSMAESVLVCDKAAVEAETITQEEFGTGTRRRLPPPSVASSDRCPLLVLSVLTEMKKLVDVEARGRVRKASIVPITITVSALTEFGRCDATSVSTCPLPLPSLIPDRASTSTIVATPACTGDPEGAEQPSKALGTRD